PMAPFRGFERGRSTRVPLNLHAPVGVDALDGPQLTVRNAALAIRRGHLHAVSRCERAIGILIERYTVKPTRVIAESAVVVRSDGHLVRVPGPRFRRGGGLPPRCRAPCCRGCTEGRRSPRNGCPLTICASDLLARDQHRRPMLLAADMALGLHRSVDHVVEILPRLI